MDFDNSFVKLDRDEDHHMLVLAREEKDLLACILITKKSFESHDELKALVADGGYTNIFGGIDAKGCGASRFVVSSSLKIEDLETSEGDEDEDGNITIFINCTKSFLESLALAK